MASLEIETIRRFESCVRGAKMYGFNLRIEKYPEPFGKEHFCFFPDENAPELMSRKAAFAAYENLDLVSGFIKGLEVQQIVQNCEKHKPRKKTKKVAK